MSVADVEIARRWQRKQQAAGLCIKCTQPRINSQHCERHAEVQRNIMRKRRAAVTRCADCTRHLTVDEINKKYRRCQVCVAASKERAAKRNARVVELRGQGKTTREISGIVGISETMVRMALQAASVSGYSLDDEPEAYGTAPRCPRCSLLLPHDACLAPVWAVASRRKWESVG